MNIRAKLLLAFALMSGTLAFSGCAGPGPSGVSVKAAAVVAPVILF